MTRRNLISTLAAVFMGLVLSFAATTNNASAQQNQNCCTYTIDVAGVPAGCFPFNVTSFWGNGFPADPIVANGVTVHNVPWACPLSSPFFGASINGQFPIASFNNPKRYNVGACCLEVRIAFDAAGCVMIYVRYVGASPC